MYGIYCPFLKFNKTDFGVAAMEKILNLIDKCSTSLELRDLTTTFQEMRAIIQHLQLSLILPDMEPLVAPADQFQEVVGNPAIAAATPDSSIPVQ